MFDKFLSLPVLITIGVLLGLTISSTLVHLLSDHMHIETFSSALLIALPLGITAGLLKKF